jgi:hypothetical protein
MVIIIGEDGLRNTLSTKYLMGNLPIMMLFKVELELVISWHQCLLWLNFQIGSKMCLSLRKRTRLGYML